MMMIMMMMMMLEIDRQVSGNTFFIITLFMNQVRGLYTVYYFLQLDVLFFLINCLFNVDLELYSYTEESEFFMNKKCFDETSLAFCKFNHIFQYHTTILLIISVQFLKLCVEYFPLLNVNFILQLQMIGTKFIVFKFYVLFQTNRTSCQFSFLTTFNNGTNSKKIEKETWEL